MEEEISLQEIFVTLWSGKFVIITVTLTASIIALLVSLFFVTPLYEATAYLDIEAFASKEQKQATQPKNAEPAGLIDDFLRRPDHETLVRQSIEEIERGVTPTLDMTEGTAFAVLLMTRDNLRSDIIEKTLKINQVEQELSVLDEESYIFMASAPETPINNRWPLNTAVAGVLGLMISVVIVFIRPHLAALRQS